MGIALVTFKRFEGSDAIIYRARKGLPMNSTATASNKLTVTSARLALVFLVSILFIGNSALRNE